jgi:hypothetical protein
MANFRRCVFDYEGHRFINWLVAVHIAEGYSYSTHKDNCWICSMLGDASGRKIEKHINCCARGEATDGVPEVWLVHGDDDHRRWNIIKGLSVHYAPAALMFVSARGSSQEFGGKEPEIVQVSSQEGGAPRFLPIFYLNAGLFYSSDAEEFEEMLRCIEIALESRDWQTEQQVRDSFRRAALLSSSIYWPYAIRLRDDANSLFYLWCAERLKTQFPTEPTYAVPVVKLLMQGKLALARQHGEPLNEMLAWIHSDLFIPLRCRADRIKCLRSPEGAARPKSPEEFVDGWLESYRDVLDNLGLRSQRRQIKDWIYADLQKWSNEAE